MIRVLREVSLARLVILTFCILMLYILSWMRIRIIIMVFASELIHVVVVRVVLRIVPIENVGHHVTIVMPLTLAFLLSQILVVRFIVIMDDGHCSPLGLPATLMRVRSALLIRENLSLSLLSALLCDLQIVFLFSLHRLRFTRLSASLTVPLRNFEVFLCLSCLRLSCLSRRLLTMLVDFFIIFIDRLPRPSFFVRFWCVLVRMLLRIVVLLSLL